MREKTGSFLRITNKTYKYFSASAVCIINLPSSLPRLFLRPVRGFVVSTRFTSDSKNKEIVWCFQICILTCIEFVAAVAIASAFYEGATKGLT